MNDATLIALLGRRDYPTDALEDYCTYLSEALRKRGVDLHLVRMPWAEMGWAKAMLWLYRQSREWQNQWVLMQYTALAWSMRGFPTNFLWALWLLRRHCRQVAIVFHDARGYPGEHLIDRCRRAWQHAVMRAAYRWADKSILTIPLERVPWLPPNPVKAVSIPVGPNIPEPATHPNSVDLSIKTVAVFGVTGGNHISREVKDIAYAVQQAAKVLAPKGQKVRLFVLGRGSEEAKPAFREYLGNVNGVAVSVLGLLPAKKIAEVLAQADALLFVRGHISGRRTSAIAGIACGLPVVAYEGVETGFPITEAGVWLAPQGDLEALSEGLCRVLTDESLWQALHQRSVQAYRRYFSWDAIANQFLKVLGNEVTHDGRT